MEQAIFNMHINVEQTFTIVLQAFPFGWCVLVIQARGLISAWIMHAFRGFISAHSSSIYRMHYWCRTISSRVFVQKYVRSASNWADGFYCATKHTITPRMQTRYAIRLRATKWQFRTRDKIAFSYPVHKPFVNIQMLLFKRVVFSRRLIEKCISQ